MNQAVINQVIIGSLEGDLTFPQVITQLQSIGVESYHVDLLRAENRYYMPSGETYLAEVPFEHPNAAEEFSIDQVKAAIKKIQMGIINYQEFLQQILAAGTVYYIAYLTGRRVIYLGRKGDFHVEYFP